MNGITDIELAKMFGLSQRGDQATIENRAKLLVEGMGNNRDAVVHVCQVYKNPKLDNPSPLFVYSRMSEDAAAYEVSRMDREKLLGRVKVMEATDKHEEMIEFLSQRFFIPKNCTKKALKGVAIAACQYISKNFLSEYFPSPILDMEMNFRRQKTTFENVILGQNLRSSSSIIVPVYGWFTKEAVVNVGKDKYVDSKARLIGEGIILYRAKSAAIAFQTHKTLMGGPGGLLAGSEVLKSINSQRGAYDKLFVQSKKMKNCYIRLMDFRFDAETVYKLLSYHIQFVTWDAESNTKLKFPYGRTVPDYEWLSIMAFFLDPKDRLRMRFDPIEGTSNYSKIASQEFKEQLIEGLKESVHSVGNFSQDYNNRASEIMAATKGKYNSASSSARYAANMMLKYMTALDITPGEDKSNNLLSLMVPLLKNITSIMKVRSRIISVSDKIEYSKESINKSVAIYNSVVTGGSDAVNKVEHDPIMMNVAKRMVMGTYGEADRGKLLSSIWGINKDAYSRRRLGINDVLSHPFISRLFTTIKTLTSAKEKILFCISMLYNRKTFFKEEAKLFSFLKSDDVLRLGVITKSDLDALNKASEYTKRSGVIKPNNKSIRMVSEALTKYPIHIHVSSLHKLKDTIANLESKIVEIKKKAEEDSMQVVDRGSIAHPTKASRSIFKEEEEAIQDIFGERTANLIHLNNQVKDVVCDMDFYEVGGPEKLNFLKDVKTYCESAMGEIFLLDTPQQLESGLNDAEYKLYRDPEIRLEEELYLKTKCNFFF